MAVRRYGKGDLCGITVQEESSYGVADTEKSKIHMGVITSLKNDHGISTEEQPVCGSRLKGTEFLVGRDVTSKVDFKISKAADWLGWFKWCLGVNSSGAVTGLTNVPQGRTVYFKVAPQSLDRLTGAYVEELKVTSEKIGAPLKFSATIYAKTLTEDVNAPVEQISTGTPLRATQGWTCSNTSIGTITGGSWTLTITQNLEKVAGADSDEVTNASGQEPYLGSPTVILEITAPARSRAVDNLKRTLTTGLVFTTQIGGKSVTISGGTLGTEGTQRSQQSYDETIKITATDISIV